MLGVGGLRDALGWHRSAPKAGRLDELVEALAPQNRDRVFPQHTRTAGAQAERGARPGATGERLNELMEALAPQNRDRVFPRHSRADRA